MGWSLPVLEVLLLLSGNASIVLLHALASLCVPFGYPRAVIQAVIHAL
jgi:hypothetical protein